MSGLRIRLLEPSVGASAGGTRVVIHGRGFRPVPHSLLVRFRLPETGARVEVPGRFLLETQLECGVPSFQDDVRSVVARYTNLAATSSTVALAPHLVTLHVEVIVDSDRVSNALPFTLHQELAITRIAPQFVLMTPPTVIAVTLNLLKLSSGARIFPPRDNTLSSAPRELAEISSLPVYARVRQTSERTGAVSERTIEARWKISPVGVFEIEFDAQMMTFGDAMVDVTLNRFEFYRATDKLPDARGYCVHRDFTLLSVDPPCVSVTSGRSTEIRVNGEGFVDSGDLVVRLLQHDIQSSTRQAVRSNDRLHEIANLTATFVSVTEVRCSVQANMPFGLTFFQLSLNGGRQFGKDSAVGLLYRDREAETITPGYASLEGNTLATISIAELSMDEVDALCQLQKLVPPRRVRVKFSTIDDGTPSEEIVKVVNAEVPHPDEPCIVRCRVPSFVGSIKMHQQAECSRDANGPDLRVKRIVVSLSLGGDKYFGALPFGLFYPPIIQSITRHHGPSSGGTLLILRMKHQVPPELPIQIRFLSFLTCQSKTVSGTVGVKYSSPLPPLPASRSPSRHKHTPSDDLASLIICTTPPWDADAPVLTKLQVSFDGGFNFVPREDDNERALVSPRPRTIPPQLEKDMSYLYFLFYPVPRLNSVNPMSADIRGGSFIRIGGENIIDHGGEICVVFQSQNLSRKVTGIVDHGEIRCCVPPFELGSAAVFVTLNGDQYTKCDFIDPDTKHPFDFMFYSSPLLRRLSPLCACITQSSLIRLYGENLFETGRIKVRFSFTNHQGKLVYKDVAAKGQDGVIMAQSPLFGPDYGNMNAVVDIALNGNDFSGRTLTLYYYSSYAIKRVYPDLGAFDIPITVTIVLTQSIVSETVIVRVRFRSCHEQGEVMFGPIPVSRWEANRVEFMLPAIAAFLPGVDVLEAAFVDVSFDTIYFHSIGDLLLHYKVYQLPSISSVSPLVGHFAHDTSVVAKCTNLTEGEKVAVKLILEVFDCPILDHPNSQPMTTCVEAETSIKRQTLTWRLPSLESIVSGRFDPSQLLTDTKRMMLPMKVKMQISTVPDQLKGLPFEFRYYRVPELVSLTPQVGYVCGGSIVSFAFRQPVETPTVDFRFGSELISSGRIRSENKCLVECLTPALSAGVHDVAVSFDEQYFEDAHIDVEGSDEEFEEDGIRLNDDATRHAIIEEHGVTRTVKEGVARLRRCKAVFQAYAMPFFVNPENKHRVYSFGSTEGGSHVIIKGYGFIAEGTIYVRFVSTVPDAFSTQDGLQSTIIIKAKVLNESTIQCVSPESSRIGRVRLEITYNLQEFTDSRCCFEYHEPTKFVSRGTLCGPVSGDTPVSIKVENRAGLPEDLSLVKSNCALRFKSEKSGYYEDMQATFDEQELIIQCPAPSWTSNELVAVEVSLARDVILNPAPALFVRTGVRFLFYDPPEGLITVEPAAGPTSGGTEVLAWCGTIVDTGEIMVSVTMAADDKPGDDKLGSLREGDSDDDDGNSDNDRSVRAEEHVQGCKVEPGVYLVKGKIVGEAISFITPAVTKPGIAYLDIALNGINYTSSRTAILQFKYYSDPVIRRISPCWCSSDNPSLITIGGDNIEDHGCNAVVCFQLQRSGLPDEGEHEGDHIRVEGSFVEVAGSLSKGSTVPSRSETFVQCMFHAPRSGYFEIQISLNGGQQFSTAKYMLATYANYSGSACTALLPFRSFSSPFFLATPTGSVAGGSTVIMFLSARLSKLLSRDVTKCQVQFTPVKAPISAIGPPNLLKGFSSSVDAITVSGEINHAEASITCRAPLLRTNCFTTLDVLLSVSAFAVSDSTSAMTVTPRQNGSLVSCVSAFNVKEREVFFAYESPTITELKPTCGPLSGGTIVVIECANIIDTGQIFVRFRSSANERECVLVPAAYSRTYPDGSLSAFPLLICRTPRVEVVDRFLKVTNDAGHPSLTSPSRLSSSRDNSAAVASSKARTQSFQQMAEQSLQLGQLNVLRVTRTVLKNASVASTSISVLTDFTMNAGEQFIAHSVPYYYYPDLNSHDLSWYPRHVPTQCMDRGAPNETRIVTVQLPKTLRSFTESPSAAERAAFYFEGVPQQLFSPSQKRRGSSLVLHEAGAARELLFLDTGPVAKLRSQSTMRRRSTYMRNTSISSSSNNLIDSSGSSFVSSPPSQHACRSSGAAGGARRLSDAVAPGGNLTLPAASATSSSPLSSHCSSPYIAARIVKGELSLVCPVPEFSCAGSVRVFFSFNAQQFVCLGELRVHDPLSLRENRHHRFTSNIGGDRFVLYCSPSTVFEHLHRDDILSEMEKQRRETGVMRFSHLHAESSVSPQGSDLSHVPIEFGRWHDRLFYVVKLRLVPPNPLATRGIVVSACSVNSKTELSTSILDDNGCCVLETTDWRGDMIISAVTTAGGTSHEPPSVLAIAPLSTFSCVVPESRFHGTTASNNGAPCMTGVMVQLPSVDSDLVACTYCIGGSASSFLFLTEMGESVEGGVRMMTDEGELGGWCFASLSTSEWTRHKNSSNNELLQRFFICCDVSEQFCDSCEQHVVIANRSGPLVYLVATLSAAVRGIWVVACAFKANGALSVVPIDRVVGNTASIVTDEVFADYSREVIKQAGFSKTNLDDVVVSTYVSVRVQFGCADSSRNLRSTASGQIILPTGHTPRSVLEDETEVQVLCEMPPLAFNGPTIVSVLVDGVLFSNALCMHCYDPRLWRITRLDPPCGLVGKSFRARVFGEHFVDNKKTVVRFSDSSRFINFAGSLERYHLVVVRIGGVRNLKALLPPRYVFALQGLLSSTNGSPFRLQQPQNREDGSSAGAVPPFTIAVRVLYQGQCFRSASRESAVLAALMPSSTTPLGWEDQFEVHVARDSIAAGELVVTLELEELTALHPTRFIHELGRVVVPFLQLEEAALVNKTFQIEQQFMWGGGPPGVTTTSARSALDVSLHMSPLMTRSDVVVCDVAPFVVPQRFRVQISSGDSLFSPCPPDCGETAEATHASSFRAYELPVVTDTSPRVLPRSAGGDVVISGQGFISCGGNDSIVVRIFGVLSSPSNGDLSQYDLLAAINDTNSLQSTPDSPFFIRDLTATFISSEALHVAVPPRLATYIFYYRVSMDGGVAFSSASHASRVMLYGADSVEPKGGPVSGNTYVALHGTNINGCMSLGRLVPVVRLTWMRGVKELEAAVVRGEFYAPEDIVYFYTPQSKFGLRNITVHIELSLIELELIAATEGLETTNLTIASARFGQDEIPFVIYRSPAVKGLAPQNGLIYGLSTVDLVVQGLDDKTSGLLKSSFKARFKRRGQMQIADAQLAAGSSASDGRLVTTVPRFNVGSAIATEVSVVASPARSIASTCNNANRRGPLKVWNRHGAIYVVLLRARNLFVAKKTATCNPFVVINCDKLQLRSTRKDATSSPIWNELFDFDWRSEKELPRLIRFSVENQLSASQSELLGQVHIGFSDHSKVSKPFSLRAWFPLRPISARGAGGDTIGGNRTELGELEAVIAFVPVPVKRAPPAELFQTAALKSTILTAMQQKKKASQQPERTPDHQPFTNHQQQSKITARSRKEHLLRVFRRQGAPSSLVPTELIVELALNGQDFWSVAPSRCLLLPPPIVVSVEPRFICLSGGTPITITGMNFAQTSALRVAFAIMTETSYQILDGKRVAVVDAQYRSNHCITCIAPSLEAVRANEASLVAVFVTSNGVDFDSVSLPAQSLLAPPLDPETYSASTHAHDAKEKQQTSPVLEVEGRDYVINTVAISGDQLSTAAIIHPESDSATTAPSNWLVHHVRVYNRPIIDRVRAADGIYTTQLVIEGSHFSNTGLVVAKYCSTSDVRDVRTSSVRVLSSQCMECSMPDFPRGTVVTISIAMNGVEFFPCSGEYAVFQLPRLTRAVPNWISVRSTQRQDVRLLGVNLTANASASGSVQVSFTREGKRLVVKGQCVDGEVHCFVPREITGWGPKEEGSNSQPILTPPIWVDVWLGGSHKTFTGQPLELQLYGTVPSVSSIAPMNGPVYGGCSITVEGSGFINTGNISVRFHAINENSIESGSRITQRLISSGRSQPQTPLLVTFVDTSGRFVSENRVVCTAPSFPHEGVFSVSIALNGVEFHGAETLAQQPDTWYLVWQNWQRRKQLVVQRDALMLALGLTQIGDSFDRKCDPSSTDTDGQGEPRSKSPRPVASDTAAATSDVDPRVSDSRVSPTKGFRAPERSNGRVGRGSDSPTRRQQQHREQIDRLIEDESTERGEDHFVDIGLLQWHPATAEEKSRSLVSLLTDLFNAPETQQVMIRRIGFLLRMRGFKDSDTGHYSIAGPLSFTKALRLIFPHAPEKEFEDLWRVLDPTQLGVVSLQSITKRLSTSKSPRPSSPEPGPAHYTPCYNVVEANPPKTVIMPESSTRGEDSARLPSEYLMNYDAFKAVRPRVTGGVFPKGKFTASWCNPVPKDSLFGVETDEEIERTFSEQQLKTDSLSLGTLTRNNKPQRPVGSPPSREVQRPRCKPGFASKLHGQAKSDAESNDEQVQLGIGCDDVERMIDDLVRKVSTTPCSDNRSKLASPRTAAPTPTSNAVRPSGGRNGRSILHDDIAPLYLKFLRSKDSHQDKKQ